MLEHVTVVQPSRRLSVPGLQMGRVVLQTEKLLKQQQEQEERSQAAAA